LRLDIRKVRTTTEKLHKKEKADILISGRAIDGVKNILVWAVSEKEKRLEEIENHFLTIESNRLDALKAEREKELLQKTDVDIEVLATDLRTMDTDVWDAYLGAKVKEKSDRVQAELDAEKARIQAEKDRIAEDERIRAENERLRLEAMELEKVAEAEREKAEKAKADAAAEAEVTRLAQVAKDKEAKKVQDAEDAEVEAEREKERKQAKADNDAIIENARLEKLETDRLAKIKSDKDAKVQKEKDDAQAKKDAKVKADSDAKQAKIQADLDAAKAKERERLDDEQAELLRIENEKEALKRAGDKGFLDSISDDMDSIIKRINNEKLKSKASQRKAARVADLLHEAWEVIYKRGA
ncbi:hypothetical protein KAR91_53205, partial [Candidatus Pacearchaeota archaeon]|nr:hypothetical protein [Candidatus Pacearchaeota archaeon]